MRDNVDIIHNNKKIVVYLNIAKRKEYQKMATITNVENAEKSFKLQRK